MINILREKMLTIDNSMRKKRRSRVTSGGNLRNIILDLQLYSRKMAICHAVLLPVIRDVFSQ